jgi:hypothetical protein
MSAIEHVNILEYLSSCKGIPLFVKGKTKAKVKPIIDPIADRLSRWKAGLLSKEGCRILVQFVITSIGIYLAMAVCRME